MVSSQRTSPRLSIVFLNYDRLAETRSTVECLRRITAGRDDVEIIAVDNGSGDGTAEYLQAQDDFLVPILLTGNTGVAGYNHGFERSRGGVLLVLDDDSCPRDAAALDRGLALLEADAHLGIVACRIENPDGSLQRTWNLPRDLERPGPSMSFMGCGFFIRRGLFEAVGWYPGEFFLYQNELEVAIRTRLRGMAIRYEPACRVVHRGRPGQRPGWRRIYYPTRNTLWLIRRHFPAPLRWYLAGSRLLIGFTRALWFRQPRAFLRAAREGLGAPLTPLPVPRALRRELAPFRRQNCLWSQLLRLS